MPGLLLHEIYGSVCCSTRFTALFAEYEKTGEPKILPFLFVVIKHTERLTGHRFVCNT